MSLYAEPNATDAIGLIRHANNISYGSIGIGIPISIAVITLITLLLNGTPKSNAFTASMVVYTIIAMILSWGGLLNLLFVIGGIILVAIGAMWMKIENSPD